MNSVTRPHLFGLLAGLFLAAGLVLSAILFTRAWLRISESQVITVTGYTKREVTSDLIVWRGMFKVQEPSLERALARLREDSARVTNFFLSRSITNFTISAPSVTELKARTREQETDESRIVAYHLARHVEITSTNVERIAALSLESSALLDEGVFFTASHPEFIYTKTGEMKILMLADATKDARARADQIVTQGGRKLGDLRSARMGVFQVTPPFSTETSGEGMNDTSSLRKDIRSVVTATFSIQ